MDLEREEAMTGTDGRREPYVAPDNEFDVKRDLAKEAENGIEDDSEIEEEEETMEREAQDVIARKEAELT